MVLNPIDKSNYLRGLLLVIKKNQTINEIEKRKIKEVSEVLGFNRGFVDNAMNELLDNEFLLESPPIFTNHKLAESFLKDAIKISLVEGVLNIYKLNWLIMFAVNNGLSKQWLFLELEYFIEYANNDIHAGLEIQNYLNDGIAIA